MQYAVKKTDTIHLGKQGEHRARELTLPEFTAWEAEYGPGEAEIIFLPPRSETPISITPARTEDGTWLWTVTTTETACPGYGKCELRYVAGDAVVKSAIYQTFVAASLGEETQTPETGPDGAQPLLIDEEDGTPYTLVVAGGKLMIQEQEAE